MLLNYHRRRRDRLCALSARLAGALQNGAGMRDVLRELQSRRRREECALLGVALEACRIHGNDPLPVLTRLAADGKPPSP
jgi:hypothetical protein